MPTSAAFARTPVPSHVPQALVVDDFDGFHPMMGTETYHEAYARWHDARVPGLFWSPYNGGHWVAARRDYLAEIFADPARFTSRQGVSVDSIRTAADDDRPRLAPIEEDPPRQQLFRKLFASAFVTTALKEREAEARALAIELIEGFQPRGRCEFVTEFAQHLPIRIFMRMVALPESDRLELLPLAQAQVAADASKHAAMEQLFKYVGQRVVDRAATPGDDLISRIATAEIEGRPITASEAIGVATLLLIGGLDTVASLMGHVMQFLAGAPGLRRQLIEEPTLIPGAVEELLRRFALTNPARTVCADTDFHGVALRAGDRVMLATPFGAVDPDRWDDPLVVDFRRKSSNKTTFGAGPHVCPGAMLARVELKVLLEEWLPRIPDFELDPADRPRILTGVNGSVCHLPLRWNLSAPPSAGPRA